MSVPHSRTDDTAESGPAGLAARIRGALLTPDDEGWDDELAPFNAIGVHRPDLVVAAENASDIQEAIRYAARHRLPVAVQATGHGIAAPADGGVLISTRRMNAVAVDPVARTARAEAGVRWHQVIDAAAEHGLAPLNGSSPLVGVVGYTLGGGLGLLARRYGYAADHVTRIHVVTAEGELREATAHRNPDLFWALRGGKGNFGVVTSIEFGLVPVATLYGGGLFFAADAAQPVLEAWRRWSEDLPEDMTSSLALLRLPDAPFIPEPLRGRLTVHVRVAFLGPPENGEKLLAPLRAVAPTVLDTVREMPYTEVGEIHMDPVEPVPYHERSILLRGLDEAAVRRLLEVAGPGSDCPAFVVELRRLGGAVARPAPVPSAVGNRDAAFTLTTVSPPAGPDDPARVVLTALEPWGTGRAYVNFLTGPDEVGDARRLYDPETYERLARIKRQYDPHHLFRFTHPIVPGDADGV
ncbi:FAD-binding oxidoreductase [Streptomyces aurantiogriseus]|uniref:Oxidoreductase n=1 Tax=Streptomyces aurantiogriseus TaxID=66870 RepID=A0A918F329_9ACTN|nr:FAD-binding oxidoreductase [Streptomyces aurantiogriseus]GGR02713.1 oxidoreductase [Streptomyces aurantiogriseus]